MAGKVVILCAPSGSGKTTLAKYLLSKKKLNLKFSISATTRNIRDNEKDGVDYHFISLESFKNKIDNNSFIEYEKVYDEIYYGTLKSEVEKLIQNHNLIFDVDVIGAISLKKYFSKKSISIFINPCNFLLQLSYFKVVFTLILFMACLVFMIFLLGIII